MRMFMLMAMALILGGCAATSVPTKSGMASEYLKIAPYPADPAWKMITDKSSPAGWMREWIPADQDENDIKDIVTAQAFYNLRGKNPQDFLQGMLSLTAKACTGGVRHSGKDHPEVSPHLSYMQIFCSFPGGKHEEVDMFIKAISGSDALYVVQREFHYPQDVPVAGVTTFSGTEAKTMVARLNEIGTTNKWLGDQVYVCSAAGDGPVGCADGSPNVARTTTERR